MAKKPPPTELRSRAKFSTLEEFLKEDYAFIHFDAHAKGVIVPEHLKSAPSVTLKISYFFKNPLELTHELIKAELCFDEGYVKCEIPLNAIWAVTSINNDTRMWTENAPSEIKDQIPQSEPQAEPSQQLAVASVKESQDQDSADAKPKDSKRPSLRRVK